MPQLGAPPNGAFYPPCGFGCVPYRAGLWRAASSLLPGLLITSDSRKRVALIANRYGWNHVQLSLKECLSGRKDA